MMTFALKLTHDEPRLVYLALVYHLGRPGSELDPATKMPVEHGLRDVKVALGSDLASESAVIELDEAQYAEAALGDLRLVTELRGHHMRGGVASTVARFTETALDAVPSRFSPIRRRRLTVARGDGDAASPDGARTARRVRRACSRGPA